MIRKIVFFGGVLLFLALPNHSQAKSLQLVTSLRKGQPAYQALINAQNRIREETDCAFSIISVQHSGEAMAKTLAGGVDLSLVPIDWLRRYSIDFRLFEGLFIFRHLDEAFSFLQMTEDLLLGIALTGTQLRGISWWGGEMMHLAGHFSPASPEDIVGLNIATRDERFRQLGASILSNPPRGLREALRDQSVDLAECNLATVEALAEQVTAVTLTNHRFRGWVLVAHRGTWQSLEPDVAISVQAILKDTSRKLASDLVEVEWQRMHRLQKNSSITIRPLQEDSRRMWRQAVANLNQDVARQIDSRYQALLLEGFESQTKAEAAAPDPPSASISVPGPYGIRVGSSAPRPSPEPTPSCGPASTDDWEWSSAPRPSEDSGPSDVWLGPSPPRPPPDSATSSIPPSFPSSAQLPNIFWNGWCETMAQKDVEQLVVGNRYRFNIDLSRYIYQDSFGNPAAGIILDELQREGQISLLLQPVLAGGHLKAPPDAPLKPKLMTIYQDRLDANPNKLSEVIEDVEDGQTSIGEFASKVNLGPRMFWDLVAQEPGCGIFTVSVWDSAFTRPLDHLIFSLPIIAPTDTISPVCNLTAGKKIQSGLLALLVDPTANDSTNLSFVDAALHIYETKGPERIYSMAVFINRERYEAAQGDLEVEDQGIYAWQLQSALSTYVSNSNQMLETVNRAHQTLRDYPSAPYPFEEVAQELRAKIFSGENTAQDAVARQALDSFKSLLASCENPTCLVQLISTEGEMIYLPFGLLAVRASEPVVPKRFKVIQPLAYNEPQQRQTCFDRWAIAIPQELTKAGAAETRLMSLDRSLSPWMLEWVDSHADLRSFFEYQPTTGSTDSSGLGLILLAHHADGYLWFNRHEQPGRIRLEQIRRPFPPGSVALIAACSTSGAAPECRAIVRQLNRLGIGAMIISSLPVDAEFGAHLSLEFLSEIRQLYESPRSATLGEILQNSSERAAARFSRNPEGFREMALEFQIVGQYELSICKRP